MRSSVLRLGLSSALMLAVSGCVGAKPAPTERAVPKPPEFGPEFRKAMSHELGDCTCEHVYQYIVQSDGYADRVRRFRGDAP